VLRLDIKSKIGGLLCCDGVEIQHHEALSDARACGNLFLRK